MVKAIFFDIDGTLRGFNQKGISDDTRHALDRARKAGIRLFIATGRHFLEVDSEDLLDGLELMHILPSTASIAMKEPLAVRSSIRTPSPAARLPSSLRYWKRHRFPACSWKQKTGI